MTRTSKQEKDLETILYFIPPTGKKVDITDGDIEAFFAFSERGTPRPQKQNPLEYNGFDALCEGKRWRGVHMGMYEDGVLEGSMPYMVILEDMPRSVVDFMKKEMFKGIDADLIEECYQKLREASPLT